MSAVLGGAARKIAGLIGGGGGSPERSRRWPDKSTAVGWGACGCLCCVFSAARNFYKAAASRETSSEKPENAPSAIFRTLLSAWP